MQFITGLILGFSLTISTLALVFWTTTISYRSTLFDNQHVEIKRVMLKAVQS